MPEYAPDAPLEAIAGRKRAGARRHERRADALRAEADELAAEARRREQLRQEVISERLSQGLDPEPSDETLAFVGTVIANDRKSTQNV